MHVDTDGENLSRYFEQMPWPIALSEGPDHRLLAANSYYRTLFLTGVDSFLGRPVAELLGAANVQALTDIMDFVYREGKAFEGKAFAFCLKDLIGSQKNLYLNFTFSPFRDESGQITGILASIHDVTHEVKAKREMEHSADTAFLEHQKLEAVLTNAPIGIAVLSAHDLTFERVNQKFAELVSPRDYIGLSWEDVYAETIDSPLPDRLRAVAGTGSPYSAQELTIWVEREKGKLEARVYDFNFVPLHNPAGVVSSLLVQCKDITEKVAHRRAREENERDLVDILESMSDAFFSVDKNWTITRVNQNHVLATHIPREAQIGKNLIGLFFADPRFENSTYLKSLRRAMNDKVFIRFEDYYEPADLHTEVRVHPKADGGLAVFFTNVSDRKQNEKKLAFERHQLESIFQLSPAAMALWRGPDFIFERVNPERQKIFPRTKLLGRPLFEVLPDLKGQIFEEALKRVYETGIPFVGHEIPALIRRDPNQPLEKIYYDFTYVRIMDGEGRPYGVYDHTIDVTDRVKARSDLEKAKLEAEQANQTKSAFLANMSHEIRTPLGAILGFAELLKDNRNTREENDRFLDIILRNGKTLTRIIDDILDLAKVESGKLETEEVSFNLYELTKEVIDLFHDKARDKSIHLSMTNPEAFPVEILSDPTRIRQILINIIGNAIKFTERGKVSLTLNKRTVGEKFEIELIVEDTGVGIADDQRDRLFQPFVQADNTTSRKYGGTGLGLVLSLRLAKALGGTIDILKSEPGQGSTFIIKFLARLPKAPADEKTPDLKPGVSTSHAQPLVGVSVLVADDSVDNPFLARRILMKNGAVVATASNGKEALDAGLGGEFDIILMDIQMPVMDGYEATRALRQAGYKKPILALTAHAMAEEIARTQAAGCNAHLTKPLDQAELIRTMTQHVHE